MKTLRPALNLGTDHRFIHKFSLRRDSIRSRAAAAAAATRPGRAGLTCELRPLSKNFVTDIQTCYLDKLITYLKSMWLHGNILEIEMIHKQFYHKN